LIFDVSYDIVRGIIYSAKVATSHDHNDENLFPKIPKETFYEWCDKLWDFDVTTWRPQTDNRAWPDKNYTNRLRHVLESKAYDLKDEILRYFGISYRPHEYFSV
jgi:hypothetical protein